MEEEGQKINTYEFPKKKEHEAILVRNGLDIERIIALRRNIHQNAELAF